MLAVVVFALGGFCLLGVSANTSSETWITARFGSILESESIVDQVAGRDVKMWYALDRWRNWPVAVQALGAGRGRIDNEVADGQRDIVYVDSEVMWQLQESGVLLIFTYVFFLIVLARRFRFAKRSDAATHDTMLLARGVLITGACLTYGHFFLLHVQTAQAPVAYWNWAVFGTAIGVALRAVRSPADRVNMRRAVRVGRPTQEPVTR